MLTYSKVKFNPLDPVAENIKIEDIAHALSLMTRANGHFKHFCSVAQHSVNCCKEAKMRGYTKRVQLGCLLNDASESYISDLTRPVKKNLSQYFVIEEKLQRVLYEKFGISNLTEDEINKIRDIDNSMLYYEFIALMDEKIFDEEPYIAMKHNFSQRDFKTVEKEFIYAFENLSNCNTGNSFVGIDGCKDGYVAVNITERDFKTEIFKTIEEICSKYSDSNTILIDMPIGLPESQEDIRPDGEGRKILSSRASCIFNTPCRQAVYEEDYYNANEINRAILGKGLSKQSFSICSKIRDIDEFLNNALEYKNIILESHPEICFAMLNYDGIMAIPIFENKKTEEGMEKRLDILSKYYEKTVEIKDLIYSDTKLKGIKDDVIDALCLAITGMRGYKNGFKTIPQNPMKDSRGILMQMVYTE
jgi:predicted RNase H-like nuclease